MVDRERWIRPDAVASTKTGDDGGGCSATRIDTMPISPLAIRESADLEKEAITPALARHTTFRGREPRPLADRNRSGDEAISPSIFGGISSLALPRLGRP